ncbi:MAG TPA: response regulator [Candidatus Omnitrophota bacterium]|nr:response regulator [Candidatus Omnitrophota bacterium]HPD84257.1 response regulator [Candidatus Omnitrophota bacterium]HRZ03113.1 response regulator [Candidatus Omnitrophota bacterium]
MAKKILFVDDESDVSAVVTFRLKKAGYEVINAVNGQEALDLAGKVNPDLILLDLRLPIISGEEVCERVKSDERLKNIPVILFTASVDNMEDKVKRTGADDFITKPFDPEQLMQKIKKLIG